MKGTCCHLDSSERPLINADEENSQMIIIIIIMLKQKLIRRNKIAKVGYVVIETKRLIT